MTNGHQILRLRSIAALFFFSTAGFLGAPPAHARTQMRQINLELSTGKLIGLPRPAKTTKKLYARDEPSLRNWWPRENGTLPDRLSFPVLDSHAQPEVRSGKAPATSPETREREAVGKVSSIFSDAGYRQGLVTPSCMATLRLCGSDSKALTLLAKSAGSNQLRVFRLVARFLQQQDDQGRLVVRVLRGEAVERVGQRAEAKKAGRQHLIAQRHHLVDCALIRAARKF